MLRLVWRGVRFARGRAVALAAGMLVAAVAFSLLTASVEVNAATVKGLVNKNWRGEYDLLVLPRGSVQTGAGSHLVQVNYLSTAARGITMSQYQRIARLPGVGVAAPLGVVGYLLETVIMTIPLPSSVIGTSGSRVLTVTSRYTGDDGLSSYPTLNESYIYITQDPVNGSEAVYNAEEKANSLVGPKERLPDGKTVIICPSNANSPTGSAQASPFGTSYGLLTGNCNSRVEADNGPIEALVSWSFPVLLAAIDPRAEDKLTGLGHAVTSGKYLAENSALAPSPFGLGGVQVPLLGSTNSFDGDTDHVTVSELPQSAVAVEQSGAAPTTIARAFAADTGTPLLHTILTGATAWKQLVSELATKDTADSGYTSQLVGQFWTADPVSYRPGPDGQLDPVPVTNPDSVWTQEEFSNSPTYLPAPPAAADTAFRTLTEHSEAVAPGSPAANQAVLELNGQFNPERLAGFSGNGPGSPLASYRAPVLTGADAASRAALGNQPLAPDGNMAGYAQQPPLLYTTFAGAAAVEGPNATISGNSAALTAPIGSIRVRVSGLRGTVTEQLDKIGTIGEDIEKATGLQVIVTAGASPQAVTIGLPAGKYGRPALQLTEDWTATNVVLLVLRQADRESLALLVLILVVCGLFLSGAALAGVRGRRAEIGALRAVGWGRRQVFTIILGEVVTLGVAAGLVGAGLSAGLISTLGLHLPTWRALLVLPVAAVLAVLAGLAPSWVAARVPPLEALMPAARAPRRKGRRVNSVTGLAFIGVARVPGRSALAATGLAVGVAGLTVLLAAHVSFSTSIGDSELAGLINGSTRGSDLIAVLLTIALSAVGIADVTYLNLRERAGELAALAASGWGRRQIGRLLTSEALVTAVAGSVAGAAVGLALAGVAFGLSLPVLAVAAAAAAGGIAIAVAATVAVLASTSGRPLAAVLAADD
jgi:putative ABC transport system permease protein